MFPSLHTDEVLPQNPLHSSTRHLTEHQPRHCNTATAAKELRKSKSGPENDESDLQKLRHRDIERQRRQEMAGLHASLRSLLPLEYIRGKRSISDHMQEAVSYIKHMEASIEDLRIHRDKLKKTKTTTSTTKKKTASSDDGSSNGAVCMQSSVTVSSCGGGIEILITCGVEEGLGFPLSKVMDELLLTELSVVSCVSSRIGQNKFLCRIQLQVNDLAYNNLAGLQHNLATLLNIGG